MIWPINLKQVKCFVAVGDELSFHRAAERLCMTQPPLSRHIQALENAVGVRLLERDRRGVQLTDAGKSFLSKAKTLLEHADDLVEQTRGIGSEVPRLLRIGLTTSVAPAFFSTIKPLFERDSPDHTIEIKRQISVRNIRDVRRGALDLALIGLPADTEGLSYRLLFEEPLMVAMPSNHRLVRRRAVSLHEVQSDALFWFDRKRNPSFYDYCKRGFDRFDYHPVTLPEPDEHHVLLGLVAAGQGITLIPTSLKAVQHKNVVYRELRESSYFKIQVAMVWREVGLPDHAAAFKQVLLERYARRSGIELCEAGSVE